MKIQCEIIRDILPLYAEDMVSQPTKNMVEEHLCECGCCAKELEILNNQDKAIQVPQVQSLKRISSIIRNSRVLSVTAAVLILISIGVWLWAFLNMPVFLDVEDAVISVYQNDNGALVIDYYDYVRGSVGTSQPGYTEGHICYSTRWEMLALRYGWYDRVFDRKLVSGSMWYETDNGTKVIIHADEDTNPEDVIDFGIGKSWWYLNYRTAKAETVLWDAGEPVPEGKLAYVICDLTWPVMVSALLAMALLLLEKRVGDQRRKAILWHTGCLCAVFSVSALLVTAGQTVLYHQFIGQLSCIVLLTALLWSTAVVLRKYRKLNMAK